MNDFIYITPKKYLKLGRDTRKPSLKWLEETAKRKARMCTTCGNEKEWKLVDTGLCFTCTTGEVSASEDYELEEDK